MFLELEAAWKRRETALEIRLEKQLGQMAMSLRIGNAELGRSAYGSLFSGQPSAGVHSGLACMPSTCLCMHRGRHRDCEEALPRPLSPAVSDLYARTYLKHARVYVKGAEVNSRACFEVHLHSTVHSTFYTYNYIQSSFLQLHNDRIGWRDSQLC